MRADPEGNGITPRGISITRPPGGSLDDRGTAARHLGEVVIALGLMAATVLGLDRFVLSPWAVVGPSMEPTLEPGDRVLVDLWTYRWRPPRSGEIALLLGPRELPLVKRVSETLPPEIPPTDRSLVDEAAPSEPRLFVLGDNVDESADSRRFGMVPAHRFQGRVIFRYWPPSRIGPLR